MFRFAPVLAAPPALPTGTFNVNSSLDQPDDDPGDGNCVSDPGGFCTLRAAIMEANDLAGPDTIVLAAGGAYTLTLPNSDDQSAVGDLDITSVLTLTVADGGHATISGGGTTLNERVLQVKPSGVARLYNVTLRNGRVRDNAGAGIVNEGDLTLTNVTVMSNFAVSHTTGLFLIGGGIYNIGDLNLIGSTISNNSAAKQGGGIYNIGSLVAVNSTISNNLAQEDGGGLYNNVGSMELYNVTLAWNYADIDENSSGTGGGLYIQSGTVNFRNTLIAHNVHGLFNLFDDDCVGTLVSGGYNLLANPTGCTVTGTTTGNQTLVTPFIGALADNGGHTRTHALLANSPARDGGRPTGCVNPFGPIQTTDQRGLPRPADGNGDGTATCDIGAFELQAYRVQLPLVER
jgi:CSLREA domain-containing protein